MIQKYTKFYFNSFGKNRHKPYKILNNSFFNFKLFQLEDETTPSIQMEGENQKEILIFFSIDGEEQPILEFMARVLQAIKIELKQDTLFINVKHDSPVNLMQLIKKYPTQSVFIFGLKPMQLGLHLEMQKYHVLKHQNVQYLWADAIDTIYQERQAGGKQRSAQLWKAMKQLSIASI